MTQPVTLAAVEDIVNFEVGELISIPLQTSARSASAAVVTAIDHNGGTFTVSTFFEERKAEIDALYEQMRGVMDSYMFGPGDVGLPPPNALAVGIAATCAIAGLGLLIARRNAVMAEEGPSEPWLKAFIEWARKFVRALFAPAPSALPAHEESE